MFKRLFLGGGVFSDVILHLRKAYPMIEKVLFYVDSDCSQRKTSEKELYVWKTITGYNKQTTVDENNM